MIINTGCISFVHTIVRVALAVRSICALYIRITFSMVTRLSAL